MRAVIDEQEISRACHDLRTVVNHLEGYVLLLREEDESWIRSPEVAEALETIHDAGQQILQVLESSRTKRKGRAPAQVMAQIQAYLENPARTVEEALLSVAGAEGAAAHGDVARLQQASLRLRHFIETGQVAEEESPAPRAAVAPASTGARVLVIEDDDGNRELLERMLRRLSYDVAGAASGAEALRVAARGAFDVILLDLMLPDMEGHALLQRLRGSVPLTPIIVISALNDIDSITRCIDEGAEDYFSKPFIPALLRTRVASALDRKRYRELLARAAANSL